MLVNLIFMNNTILSCLLLFFLIIDLYLLIPAVMAQISNPAAKLLMLIKITNEEAKVEIETNPVTAEAKISKSSIQFKDAQTFLCL